MRENVVSRWAGNETRRGGGDTGNWQGPESLNNGANLSLWLYPFVGGLFNSQHPHLSCGSSCKSSLTSFFLSHSRSEHSADLNSSSFRVSPPVPLSGPWCKPPSSHWRLIPGSSVMILLVCHTSYGLVFICQEEQFFSSVQNIYFCFAVLSMIKTSAEKCQGHLVRGKWAASLFVFLSFS